MKKFIASFLVCASCIAGEPTPTPSPTPEITQPKRKWLIAESSDSSQPPGANPLTTYLITTSHVIVRQLPDGSYMITFEP